MQNKHKHTLSVFKHFVFAGSWRTNPLFSCYGKPSITLVPLNLKIEEKLIKAGQRETHCELKLRTVALEILICLSLHNMAQSKHFFTNIDIMPNHSPIDKVDIPK
ncbi:MAG: hypothetical protein LBL04_16100 [Bacteroidales bacterium]|nr:hypothetical protein [Bacteroidales bacterium]